MIVSGLTPTRVVGSLITDEGAQDALPDDLGRDHLLEVRHAGTESIGLTLYEDSEDLADHGRFGRIRPDPA